MRNRLLFLIAVLFPVGAAEAQQALPPDIHPVTLSRMPPITRSELDAEGQKAFDARATPPTPGPGPGTSPSTARASPRGSVSWAGRSACRAATAFLSARACSSWWC